MNVKDELSKQQNSVRKSFLLTKVRQVYFELLHFAKWLLIFSGLFTWYVMHMIYNYNLSFGIPGFYRGEEVTLDYLGELYHNALAEAKASEAAERVKQKRGK